MKNVKKNIERIPAAEVRLAAMWLATSNLGQPEPRSADAADVASAWAFCVQVHACEGIEVEEEYRDWLRKCQGGDSFCAEQWAAFKRGEA